jgi:hypothetical protein
MIRCGKIYCFHLHLFHFGHVTRSETKEFLQSNRPFRYFRYVLTSSISSSAAFVCGELAALCGDNT